MSHKLQNPLSLSCHIFPLTHNIWSTRSEYERVIFKVKTTKYKNKTQTENGKVVL